MELNWIYFPQSDRIPQDVEQIVDVFECKLPEINSYHNYLKSDDVLATIADSLEAIGFKVERSKSKKDKIEVPVLFGLNGKTSKSFNADAYNQDLKIVIEVEAGRGVTNYQFLKDIFQASVMHDIDYLVIAVRNIYKKQKDFETVITFLETLYASSRFTLPLKGILIIGY